MKSISLTEIADRLDFYMEDWRCYLNKITGEFVETQTDYLSIAEESEDDEDFNEYQDGEQEAIQEALDVVVNWEDYVELPDRDEVNEYRIMERFCDSQEDEKLRNKLCYAIEGKGAFRRFKDSINRYGIEKEWYSYKHEALCKIAREWCEFNNIEFVVDSQTVRKE